MPQASTGISPLGLGALCCCLLPLLVQSTSDVIQLTDENFDELVSEGNWFIKIYAPWCSHCRKVEGIWENVATELKEHNTRVGNIDATKEKVLTKRFDPEGFPSFYHLTDGECREYRQQRSKEEFVGFALGGWRSVEPWPFYKAPNSFVGKAFGSFLSLPGKFRFIYKWLSDGLGFSDLGILAILIFLPVSFVISVICMIDLTISRRVSSRPHAD